MKKEKELWEQTLKIGNKGEEFIEEFCKTNNIQFKKGTDDENVKLGIDAYILGVPTDIKTTCKIFLAKYMLDYNKFHVRHPFRNDTRATNYCIIDDMYNPYSIRYMGNIEEYLINNYFKSKNSLYKIKSYLNEMEGKTFRQCKCSNENEIFERLKSKLSFHIQDEIYCTYTSKSQALNKEKGELNIALLTYADHRKLNKLGRPIF